MTRLTAAISALFAATILLAAAVNPASAESRLERRVDAATDVLEQISRIPEQGIPPHLLRNAHAIAVIPNLVKAGFIIGGSYGKGILVVRHPDGRWSNPAFISMTAGSIGWQAGAQSSDIILVFKNRRGVENIARGKLTLGGDANIAAGPVGRRTLASTDIRLKAEIYSYSRNRGLFAGISLEGAVITMDHRSNFAFYQSGDGTAERILSDPYIPTPAHARRFIETLTAKAPRLERQAPVSRTAENAASRTDSESTNARTYGIDDAPSATGDVNF